LGARFFTSRSPAGNKTAEKTNMNDAILPNNIIWLGGIILYYMKYVILLFIDRQKHEIAPQMLWTLYFLEAQG
jgi:hypothetical protein